MSASRAHLDDVLLHCPVGEVLVLTLFFSLDNVTREMASDMFHAFIPTALSFKDSAAEATSTPLRGLALFHPATTSHVLQTVFEQSPILGISVGGRKSSRARAGLGFVHSSMMLSKKVFAIEIIVDAFVTGNVGVQIGVARADVATVEAELQMLDGDVTFPFIFGTQCDIAAVVGERADELAFGGFGSFGPRAGRFASTRLDHAAWVSVGTRDGLQRVFAGTRLDDAIRRTASQRRGGDVDVGFSGHGADVGCRGARSEVRWQKGELCCGVGSVGSGRS